MSRGKLSDPITARVGNTSDGHGAQFVIVLENAGNSMPRDVMSDILQEKALYVDAMTVEGNDLIISFCRGSLLLAKVDHRWNSHRKDEKYRVIMREDITFEDEPQAQPKVEGNLT